MIVVNSMVQSVYMKIVCQFFLLLCMFSCHSRNIEGMHEDNDSYDTIYVYYHKGIYETSTRTPCNEMKEWSEDEDVSEVIAIDKDDYGLIYSYLSEYSNKGNVFTACEARIYVRASEYEICIDDCLICACDTNEKEIPVDDHALYLIRSLSGYYNYFYSLDLQYDRLIKEYGMPVNYEDRTVKHINWEDEENYNDFRKVALVRE